MLLCLVFPFLRASSPTKMAIPSSCRKWFLCNSQCTVNGWRFVCVDWCAVCADLRFKISQLSPSSFLCLRQRRYTMDLIIESPDIPDLNSIFTKIRDNLDAHYDRRERLIKISRDITALSKKMIFSLQRIQGEVTSLPQGIQKQIEGQEGEIRKLLSKAEKDIQGANAYRSPSQPISYIRP